ncbi:serine protease inhibitor [Nomia melanderi]|uniref:serine protease inhibitor n=1 Tax=Nomia melanderi TaxID=2448451 RepID=UPI003FCDE805
MKCLRVNCALIAFVLIVSQEITMATVLYKPDIVQTETCEENEVYSSCAGNPACEKTCENLDTWESAGCTYKRSCIDGCICKEGYVRDKNRVCVWENRCPRVKH